MAHKRRYRKWAATFLLVLYAFVAAPVGYWHHHPEKAGTHAGLDQAGTALELFQPRQAETGPGDCKICAHQYSAYLELAQPSFFFTPPYRQFCYQFCIPALLAPAQFAFTNKGPPATA